MVLVRLLPGFLVDLLPVDWWRPGNFHALGRHSLHFGDDDHVRSVDWDGRVIAQGKRLFPYGQWDDPGH